MLPLDHSNGTKQSNSHKLSKNYVEIILGMQRLKNAASCIVEGHQRDVSSLTSRDIDYGCMYNLLTINKKKC